MKFDQLTKKKRSFDQTPKLTENFDQLKMSSEIRSTDPCRCLPTLRPCPLCANNYLLHDSYGSS